MSTRLVALSLTLMAVVVTALAVGVMGWSRPSPTMLLTKSGDSVAWVLPGGPLWEAGIRDGQTVLAISSGVDPSEWSITTSDGRLVYSASYASLEDELRAQLPLALFGLLCVGVGIVLVRRVELTVAAAAVGLACAAQALMASEASLQSSTAVVVSVFAPLVWVGAWGAHLRRLRAGLAVGVALTTIVWIATRYFAPDYFDAADLARLAATVVGLVAVAVVLGDWHRWRGRVLSVDPRRVADLFLVSTLLALAVIVALATELPVTLLIVAAVAAILIYPALRTRLAATIDQLLFGDMRTQASLRAVEDERGRIARDIHDEPLQEIAAVIRDLDRQPGTEAQADVLRQAAGHLRRVTTELRPPVLDDLGLRAALAHVVDAAADRGVATINAELSPDDLYGERPPADVELALFRIVQEAVDNALRHSGALSVTIRANVLPDSVRVEVIDDGAGIGATRARDALSNGHVGLVTMAQRAALIGARFEITAARPHGTIVRVTWQQAQ